MVSLRKNLWYCFTGCNTGGDIIDLVRRLDGKDFQQTLQYLKGLAGCQQSGCTLPPRRPKPFKPFVRRLPLDHNIAWLQHKNITPETAALFEAGGCYGKGFLADSIGIRLYDLHGDPIGYAARRLPPAIIKRYGKYQFPPGFPKSATLYNYHRIARSLPNKLVITECPWSVMRLHQINIPAVALMGTSLSDTQCSLLEQIKDIVLMLDGDDAGFKATQQIETTLKKRRKSRVRPIYLPCGLDPDDLSDDELRARLNYLFF